MGLEGFGAGLVGGVREAGCDNNQSICRSVIVAGGRNGEGGSKKKRKCAVRKKVNSEQGSMIKDTSVLCCTYGNIS